MKVHKILILSFVSILIVTSCNVLDKEDLTTTTADVIFNDSSLVKLNMDYIYDQNLPTWFGNTGGTVAGTVNSLSEEAYSDNKFTKGTLTTDDVTDIGTALSATNNYGKIRTINTFIRDVRAGSMAEGTKNRFVAQALFFRAFRYFELVRLYGGVSLVLVPLPGVGQDAKDEALLPRNKTSECIKQIVSDLDTVIKYLPAKWTNADYGRITSGAAAAFKGRVLLTWASPQFNPSNLQARWQDAYDANLQAVTILSANGYGLNSSYDNMWFTESYSNPEAVLTTGFNTATGDQTKKNNTYDNQTRPAYLGTQGGSNQPTWDLVQAYPMLDGKAPGTSTKYSYSIQSFYKNRDPRFNKTIAYNGCTWPILGNSNYRLWTYYIGSKSVEPTGATNTGFYLRKAIDPNVSAANVQYSGTDWMEIRYAEVLLNLGECAAELNRLGVSEEAYQGIIATRRRAGIEAGTDGLYGLNAGMTHDQMIAAIMYERQIEFAFEGKRFWDLRRRNLLESTLNGKKRTGITITLASGAPSSLATSPYTNRDGVAIDDAYTYFTITTKNLDASNINFQVPGIYFFALPTSSISNNPNLLQNNTWGGTFDPLQ